MREKIAKALYEAASKERDDFIDEQKLDVRKSYPWDRLSGLSRQYWEGIARQIVLPLIREEIKKVENPYPWGELRLDNQGFEVCRQEIIKALEP